MQVTAADAKLRLWRNTALDGGVVDVRLWRNTALDGGMVDICLGLRCALENFTSSP